MNHNITVKHKSCGNIYSVSAGAFAHQNAECWACSHKNRGIKSRKTTEEFRQELTDMYNGEFELIGNYYKARKSVKIKHKNCGKTFKRKASRMLTQGNCPHCHSSKGEASISEFLESLNISFGKQKRFEDCRYQLPLPFDFVIYQNDGSIASLIEFDGEQHYKPVMTWGGESAFLSTQRRDAIKTKYCADHNIPLIRIPYWEFDNIDEILTKELRKLGVIETENIAS